MFAHSVAVATKILVTYTFVYLDKLHLMSSNDVVAQCLSLSLSWYRLCYKLEWQLATDGSGKFRPRSRSNIATRWQGGCESNRYHCKSSDILWHPSVVHILRLYLDWTTTNTVQRDHCVTDRLAVCAIIFNVMFTTWLIAISVSSVIFALC